LSLDEAVKLKIEPATRAWKPNGQTPTEYVISMNLIRRHLSVGQRAMIARRCVTTKKGDNRFTIDSQNCLSIDAAASAFHVSPTSIKQAGAVLDHGIPELIALVDQGTLDVAPAATAAKLTPKEQQE
jgi:hypothetical protein